MILLTQFALLTFGLFCAALGSLTWLCWKYAPAPTPLRALPAALLTIWLVLNFQYPHPNFKPFFGLEGPAPGDNLRFSVLAALVVVTAFLFSYSMAYQQGKRIGVQTQTWFMGGVIGLLLVSLALFEIAPK